MLRRILNNIMFFDEETTLMNSLIYMYKNIMKFNFVTANLHMKSGLK